MNQGKALKWSQAAKKKSAENCLPKMPWQKPQLQQLRVSLDTAFMGGSATDGLTGSVTP